MPRNPEGYEQTLAFILSTVGHSLLTPEEVAKVSGLPKYRISERFYGWDKPNHGKRMPAAVLARQLCK